MSKIAQSDVHNATQRAFVKCVAVNWGLGLSLWQKEEKMPPAKPVEDLSIHNIFAIRERIQQKFTARMQGGMSMADVYALCGLSEKAYTRLMASFDMIALLEQQLGR